LTDEGHKVHRLVLTGYLKAMEEMGHLSSRDFPPSKVYSISGTSEKDIYETVDEIVANMPEIQPERKPAVKLYFFQKLFKRPIFGSEMARAGYGGDPEAFALRISNEERLELKKQLAKKGFKLAMKEQAYMLPDTKHDAEFDEIMLSLVMQKFRVSGLSVDTKQTKLGI
jgi:hypothetical protein